MPNNAGETAEMDGSLCQCNVSGRSDRSHRALMIRTWGQKVPREWMAAL
jgi:hypothetical protein